VFREARRSTRVPLKVAIAVESGAESLTREGETVVVNLHGTLLSTTIGLSVGMRISIHVYLTDKRAKARVVYADPENTVRCRKTFGGCRCRPLTGMRQRPWSRALKRVHPPVRCSVAIPNELCVRSSHPFWLLG
jgi:hypothetical protein